MKDASYPGVALVTGAAGFIGGRLVRRLLAEGQNVAAFDLGPPPDDLIGVSGLTWHTGDIRNAGLLESLVSGCQLVFHLAAVVGDWGAEALHQAVTVEGTQALFEAIKAHAPAAVVVLASSIVVYGDQIGQKVCHERLPMGRTLGPYSRSKQAQERIAAEFLKRGLDIRIVRPANVYGAGSKPWVADLVRELRKGTPALIGGGRYDAGLVHVDNVVEILIRAARIGDAGQIYNAADEEGVTWARYMTDIAAACGAPSPKSIPRGVAATLAAIGEPVYRALRARQRPPITQEALNLVGSAHRIDMQHTRSALNYRPVRCYAEGLREIQLSLRG